MEGRSRPAAERRRLLVLGAGAAQLGLLEEARALDLFTIAVDRDPAAPGFALADRRALISTEDEPGIDRLAEAERVHGVIAPGIDWPVAIAARVAKRLGLRHPLSPESAVLATSKVRQRERFAEAGVPQPESRLCKSADEARAAAADLGLPCVVKAPDRQGQRGLALVTNEEALDAAVDDALRASRAGACLVEQLVDGQEVTVNAFSVAGRFYPLTVTDRVRAEPPAFGVALAHVWPSALEPAAVGAAIEAARRATEALDITDGPTYTQVVVGDGRPHVVEVAARLGGGHDAELCEAALGVDLNELALAAALGETVPAHALAPLDPVGGAVTRFLVAPMGELRSVEGVEEAQALEGVVRVRVYRTPGWRFSSLRVGADRAGAVQAVGETREEALERSAAAADRIRFLTADVDAKALA
ncbi:MAG TPA: ATP-grasp domain-containing protein [Gaiellaceae bacterium]|nr:ATP-grasp domain-containing protein [Gaiellaceae bacterium]